MSTTIHESSSEGSIVIIQEEELEEVQPSTAHHQKPQEPAAGQSDFVWARGPYTISEHEELGVVSAAMLYFGFAVLIGFAYFADFLRKHRLIDTETGQARERVEQESFASLDNGFESTFVNNIYRMATDVVNRPIVGVPGAVVRLKDRITRNFGWSYE
ncbi:unnamed protein product, partial [Mesorhabditis spiculigera]